MADFKVIKDSDVNRFEKTVIDYLNKGYIVISCAVGPSSHFAYLQKK